MAKTQSQLESQRRYDRRPDIMERRKSRWKTDEGRALRRACVRANPEKTILRKARARARQQGMKFDLELADIIIPQKCPILGIYLAAAFSGPRGNMSPSLDRIDSRKGYVKGNVWVISDKANRMKNDGTLEELIALGEWAWQYKTIEVI